MTMSYFSFLILAIALPSLRISPQVLNRTWLVTMSAIVLLHTAVIASYAVYIQSIGSGMNVFSDIYTNFFFLDEISILHFFAVPFAPHDDKPKRLTGAQKSQFTLSDELNQILVGLVLGDLHVYKQNLGINPCLMFIQGLVHKEYLLHLYDLYKSYSRMSPVITNLPPDKRTGNIYSNIHFNTYSLPCFVEIWKLFYLNGKKVIPSNIADLLTPLALAYWISDDGCFCTRHRVIYISTNSFTLEEVKNLVNVLNNKFGLNCTINKQGSGFRIRIPSKSLPVLQNLLESHMPSMMRFKIDL